MNLTELVKSLDAQTARAFVRAARNVIDAMLVEAARVEETHTPAERDYNAAGLSREAPAGGWLSGGEVRQTAQKVAEAMAAEKWTEGVVLTMQLFAQLGMI